MRGGDDATDVGTDRDAKSKSLGISHHIGCSHQTTVTIAERSTIVQSQCLADGPAFVQSKLCPLVVTHGISVVPSFGITLPQPNVVADAQAQRWTDTESNGSTNESTYEAAYTDAHEQSYKAANYFPSYTNTDTLSYP